MAGFGYDRHRSWLQGTSDGLRASVGNAPSPSMILDPPAVMPVSHHFSDVAVDAIPRETLPAIPEHNVVSVQRDATSGSSVLPPMPNFQLSQGPLLQGGLAGQRADSLYRLKLDPVVHQQALTEIVPHLEEDRLEGVMHLGDNSLSFVHEHST